MLATRKLGPRLSLALLALLTLSVVATTRSVGPSGPQAPVRHVDQARAMVSTAIHDRSESLRGLAAQPVVAAPSAEVGLSEGNEIESRQPWARNPGSRTTAASSRPSFGPRPAIPAAISFDNGLNGGSTSDNNIAAGPDSIVVMRNSQFKVMSKTGDTLLGPGQQQQHLRGHQRGAGSRADRLHDRRRVLSPQLRRRARRSRSRAARTTPRRASRRRCRAATSSSRSR